MACAAWAEGDYPSTPEFRAVANLLNGSGPLGALSGLLNRILALLGS
jgi:hypothetical protein